MKNLTFKMKSTLLALILMVSLSSAQVWNSKNNFTGVNRYASVAFTVGNRAFVGTGTNATTDFFEFHFSGQTWVPRANFPVSTAFAFSFSIGSKGYVGCGTGAGTTNFWEYDPILDKWTAKKSLNTGSGTLEGASGFSIGNKGYVCGGQKSGVCTNELWQYNPSNDTWVLKSTYPISPRMNASCFVINGKAYYGLGGQNYTAQYKDFAVYDTLNNSWGSIAQFPVIPRMGACSAGIDDYGLIFGGQDNSGVVNGDVWQYLSKTDTWVNLTNIPLSTKKNFASCFVINKKAYVTCGITNILYVTNMYQTNTWELNVCPLTIKGNVSYGSGYVSGTTAKTLAFVYRYSYGSRMQKVDSIQLDFNGLYNFVLAHDNYVIHIEADPSVYPDLVPTYSGDSISWDNTGSIITGSCSTIITKNIKMAEITPVVGNGSLSGNIKQGKGYKSAKMMATGDPLQGIDVSIGKRPKPKYDIVGHTKTDANGNYSFNGLGIGDYQVLVDIAGLPMDSTYNFSVTSNDTLFKVFDYIADSVNIHKKNNYTGIHDPVVNIENLNVYPNPFMDHTSVSISVVENSLIEIEIYNMLGEKISVIENTLLNKGEYKYNVSILGYGMFLLVAKSGGHISNCKIINVE